MGIWDRLFSHKEQNTDTTPNLVKENENLSVSNEIASMILILENLSILSEELIRERIREDDFYNESILKRLEIEEPKGLEYVVKYFGKLKFGYGSYKIEQIKQTLNNVATEKLLAGYSNDSVIDLLISLVKNEIVSYQDKLIRFNEALRHIEETAASEKERIEMIQKEKEYYKEQEFGYPVSLEKKIESMKKELRDLPYNGYGELEIQKFEDSAKKVIEEARLQNEDAIHTVSRIHSDLFSPMKNRFLGDVERLQKKLQMIEESPYISEFEKEQNKQKAIKEFEIMNGHQKEKALDIEELKKNLASLEYGGYGEEMINQFARRAETMISDGKRIMKPEEEVRKEINMAYQKLMDHYNEKLTELKAKEEEIDRSPLTEAEKEQKKEKAYDDFHDEMGLPIDYEERINKMAEELQSLDRGGYGELKISEFKVNAFERLERASTRVEIRDALQEVRDVEEHMIVTYKEALRRLVDAIERTNHDRHLSEKEKERAIEEYSRDFKFNMGYRMNFEKYIENRAEELATLEGGGYGQEAVEAFKKEATSYAETLPTEKDKYETIRQRFSALKRQYNRNYKTFQEWKKMQLEKTAENERETMEKDLNVKMAYMLSLSPQALYDYYMEDDRKKKEQTEKHNFAVAFRYLARQEARHQNDETIYQRRMMEFTQGMNPYTEAEIEDATKELEILSLTREDIKEEDRIISLMEYIDSTLLRQIMYAEASLMKHRQI